MQFTFKIGAKIKEAWVLYKENLGNIVLFMIAVFVFSMILNGLLVGILGKSSILSVVILQLISFIFSLFYSYLWLKSNLNMIDGKGFKPFSKEVFTDFSKFWNFIKTNILIVLCWIPFFLVILPVLFLAVFLGKSLIVAICFCFLIFFISIYFMIRLFPAIYLSLDKDQGARKNFIEAWSITKGKGWKIFGKLFVILLFIIVGVFAIVIGLIVTYPIGMVVTAMLYRELVKFKSGVVVEAVKVGEVPVVEVKV